MGLMIPYFRVLFTLSVNKTLKYGPYWSTERFLKVTQTFKIELTCFNAALDHRLLYALISSFSFYSQYSTFNYVLDWTSKMLCIAWVCSYEGSITYNIRHRFKIMCFGPIRL